MIFFFFLFNYLSAVQDFEASNVPGTVHRDHTEVKKSEKMSSAFGKLYRSVISHLRHVDVNEVKDSLRYLSNPLSSSQRCVLPSVYEDAASTKDLLDRLHPEYINFESTFLLEEIVDSYGSRRCKKLLREYTDIIYLQ